MPLVTQKEASTLFTPLTHFCFARAKPLYCMNRASYLNIAFSNYTFFGIFELHIVYETRNEALEIHNKKKICTEIREKT